MTEDDVPPSIDPPIERRQEARQPTRLMSQLRISLDSAGASDGSISHVTVTNISQNGIAADDLGLLVPGALVMLDVPLLGWRDAEVVWIDGQRAGCRFLQPLTLDELGSAVAGSPRLRNEFPGLADNIG